MQVTTTVPIEVKGKLICEFEVEVDIGITHRGSPAQTYGPPENCHPGEAPEWEELGYTLLATMFDKESKTYRTEQVECPEGLKPYVEEHLQSGSYLDMVSIGIMEQEMEHDY